MGGNAIAVQDQRQLAQTPVGRKFIVRQPEVRKSIVIVLQRHTKRQLADATETTIEGARHWVNGSRIPDLTSIINLARSLPEVRAWLYGQIEMNDRAAQAGSDDAVTEALVRLARDGGLDQMVRAALKNACAEIDAKQRMDRENNSKPREELARAIETEREKGGTA